MAHLLDVDATGSVAPTLTSVSTLGGAASGTGEATALRGKPLSSLSTSQLTFCLREFADQLAAREGQSVTTPAG